MHTAANINLFFTNVSSFKGLRDRYTVHRAELRPQIVFEIAKGLYEQNSLLRAADRFCQLADNAYAFRQMDIVEELGKILIDAPLPRQYESIGQYYQALSICRKLGVIESRPLFERVIDKAPLPYRARAMVSLGTTFVQTGDLQCARELYNDALRALRNNWAYSQTIVLTHRMIAVAKSIDGDHPGALKELERFLPLARMVGKASPQILFDYLNGCAVEQAEVGRIDEARNTSNIVLASEYAFAYPEWRETRDDLDIRAYRMSRSVVSFAQKTKPQNVLHLPERNYDTAEYSPNPFQPQASVVSLKTWKSKMVKEPNGEKDNDENLDEMDEKDLIVKLLQLTAYEGVDQKKLRKVVEYAKRIMSEPSKK